MNDPAASLTSSLTSVESHPNLPPQEDGAAIQECADWLRFHRLWGGLSDEAIAALASAMRLVPVAVGSEIYTEDQPAVGFYLVKWGSVELYRSSPVGRTHICYRNAGELFGYVPATGQEKAIHRAGAIALSASQVWFLAEAQFQQLTRSHPEVQGILNRLLAEDLTLFAQRLAREQARIQGLQPYLKPIASATSEEPLIGSSKVAQKLAQQIEAAAKDLKPVVLQSPPGAGKTFVAGTIHGRSGLQHRPFAELDCAQLPRDEAGVVDTAALFGAVGGRLGLLELLERGTLLVDNAHLLTASDRDRLIAYLTTGRFAPNSVENTVDNTTDGATEDTVESWVRLMLASPQKLSLPGVAHHAMKLYSLPQRKADIPDFAAYFMQRFCREAGRSPLELDPADLRRLISYDYPGNLGELAAILKRAVAMTPVGQTAIAEQVLWSVQSEKNAFRIDLLNQLPWLRRFLLSDWWTHRLWILVMVLFVPVTAMGFLGPQTRADSMTLNLFWAWWWPSYLFLFAFVGRLWCAVCPFMITGEVVRWVSLRLFPRQLRPWNTRWLNRWGAWVLFAGFLAIYLWEHLWDLPHTAYLSSWLLLAITAGAVLCSLVYERRLWCRYLCPIGGMNGMFAKLAIIELRSTQQVCGSQCSTFGCYKGSDATPVSFADALPREGQATGGCPLYSHPAQLPDNRDCVLCMTCLKACPHRSVQLNLRFPATDLFGDRQGFWAEVALLLLLFGGVFLHCDRRILSWLGWGQVPVDANHLLVGLPISLVLLSVPAVFTYGIHAIARAIDPQLPTFRRLVYAFLPFTLAANLAYYIPAAITEAGQILPVIARTFGFSGAGLPTLTWSNDVAAFLQGVTLLSALAFSVYPLRRIAKRPWLSTTPHLLATLCLTVLCFYLVIE